jgi:hypothetical protein
MTLREVRLTRRAEALIELASHLSYIESVDLSDK